VSLNCWSRRKRARLSTPHISGCRSAASKDSTHLWLPQRSFLAEATVASLGLTARHASGCFRADELVASACEIHRETGRRGDPRGQNWGFALPPAAEGPSPLWLSAGTTARSLKAQLLSPSREIFFDSVLRIEKCVLASRTSPSPRLPVISIARRDRRPPRKFLRLGLRFGSQRCAESLDGHVYGHARAISI
jgi:hypothetical protein